MALLFPYSRGESPHLQLQLPPRRLVVVHRWTAPHLERRLIRDYNVRTRHDPGSFGVSEPPVVTMRLRGSQSSACSGRDDTDSKKINQQSVNDRPFSFRAVDDLPHGSRMRCKAYSADEDGTVLLPTDSLLATVG